MTNIRFQMKTGAYLDLDVDASASDLQERLANQHRGIPSWLHLHTAGTDEEVFVCIDEVLWFRFGAKRPVESTSPGDAVAGLPEK